MQSTDLWTWSLAVLPIVLLVTLVLRSDWSTARKALVTAATALVIGGIAFGAGPAVLGVGVGKGVWTGVWILYVIWPGLLLYQVARRGGLDQLGEVVANALPRQVEGILLVAWVIPSFIQGVAGFGTPIAVAAPLLLAMGVGPVMAVALPLIGYHWSVTFGSMASSFYMGALTSGISSAEQARYAEDAALILGVNLLVSGILVCLMHGGWQSLRQGARMLAVTGGTMALALNLAVRVEPAVGSLAAAAAGLVSVSVLRATSRRVPVPPQVPGTAARTGDLPGTAVSSGGLPGTAVSSGDPVGRGPALTLVPYAYLLLVALAVFLPPVSRAFVRSHLLLGFSFPSTETRLGIVNDAVTTYTPIALLGHPGSFILVAAALGYLTYRRTGIWPAGAERDTVRDWFAQARKSGLSVVALAVLATVLVDTGMVRAIATGAADVAGGLFPIVSPVIGALGSFTTGSTTTSNALFSALQSDVAHLIGVGSPELLAAQTAGGNVGNSLAPVVMLVGLTAIGAGEDLSPVLRRVLVPAAALMVVAVGLTWGLIWAR